MTTSRYVGSASDSLFDTSTPTAVLPVTEMLASPVASGCTADRRFFTSSAVSSVAGPLFGITCSSRVVPSALAGPGWAATTSLRPCDFASTCLTSASDVAGLSLFTTTTSGPLAPGPKAAAVRS